MNQQMVNYINSLVIAHVENRGFVTEDDYNQLRDNIPTQYLIKFLAKIASITGQEFSLGNTDQIAESFRALIGRRQISAEVFCTRVREFCQENLQQSESDARVS